MHPVSPYRVGFAFEARRHIPPVPIGDPHENPQHEEDQIPDEPDKKWGPRGQLDFCIANPPRKGETHSDKSTKLMEITGVIRRGYDTGPQVVIVDHNKVAKIIDPLYYEDYGSGPNIGVRPFNVVRNADDGYSREAAAYIELQKSQEAERCTPAFHGCWTAFIKTPTGDGDLCVTREVRFILMEYLEGILMTKVGHYLFWDELRHDIIRKIIDTNLLLDKAGVQHCDIAPQNIVLVGDWKKADFKVKFIDFSHSVVKRYHEADEFYVLRKMWEKKTLGKMRNPAVRHWNQAMEFVDYGWFDDGKTAEQWLLDTVKDDDKYVPLAWDPEYDRPMEKGFGNFIDEKYPDEQKQSKTSGSE